MGPIEVKSVLACNYVLYNHPNRLSAAASNRHTDWEAHGQLQFKSTLGHADMATS